MKTKNKFFLVRFTTKMGMTAAPNKKFKLENFPNAASLADHVFRNETKNLFHAYTFSVQLPDKNKTVFHYSADYGKLIK